MFFGRVWNNKIINMGRILKGILSFIAIVITFTIATCCGKTCSNASIERNKDNKLSYAVKQMNKELPKKFDNMILERIELHENRELRYCFTVTNSNIHPNQAQIDIIKQQMIERTRNDTNLQKLKEYEITMSYEYNNTNGVRLALIKIYPKDYQ